MKRMVRKALEIAFGAILAAACASCMFFGNKKVLATLAFACALLSGAGLAAAIGNFLIVYSIIFGGAAFFLATICLRAYGQKKFIEGYDFRKNA